VEHSLMVNQTT